MPCFIYPEQEEGQKRIDNANYGKHLACRLLTHIFFEENTEKLINELKKEANKSFRWYKSHLEEDIEYCKNQIESLLIHLKGSEYDKVFLRTDITREELINKFREEIKEWSERKHKKEEMLRRIIDMKLEENK